MKKNLILFICAVLLINSQIFGQDREGKGVMLTYSSPQGNYLRVLSREGNMDEVMKNTNYFKIFRGTIGFDDNKTLEIGKINRMKKASDVENHVGKEAFEDFKRFKNLKTNTDVENFLQNENRFDSLAIFTETNIKFLEVFGYGFLDKGVEKDSIYYYEITRVDKNGTEEHWGQNEVYAKNPNPELLKIKPIVETIYSTDSLVMVDWVVNFNEFVVQQERPVFEEIDEKLPIKDYLAQYHQQTKTLGNHINSKAQDNSNTKFNVYYKINNETDWHFHSKRFVFKDSLNQFKVSATVKCFPEDLVAMIAIPEDYPMSSGDTSEIAEGYAISNNSVQWIYSVRAKDSTNAIIINWDKLPQKPYYTGVTVARSFDENETEVLAQLSHTDTEYIDYNVAPGKNYNYYVSATFSPKQNVKQGSPANVVGACTKFAKPLPPFNLQVDTLSKVYPKLSWETADNKAFFGFYIYRGLSPDKMTLASTVIREKSYTDSTETLSGRSTYYYAVLEQNLTQDTSDFSNTVSFSPIKREEMWVPAYLTPSLINNELILEWNDVKPNDDFVAGYLLQKRKESEKYFKAVSSFIIVNNSFVDTTFIIGEKFFYRIASISLKGDTSEFSPEITMFYSKNRLEPIQKYALVNKGEGIFVEWPSIETDEIKAYKIYRKSAESNGFELVGTVEKGNFEFLDTTIKENEAYTYSVVTEDKLGRETIKTNIFSITRNKPKDN
jgi:hypothetical protein